MDVDVDTDRNTTIHEHENLDVAQNTDSYTEHIDVKVNFCHGKILVWDPKDAMIIRKTYRIVGSFVGCFPPKPRQNTQLCLPLQLSKVEAKYILEHNKAHLVGTPEFSTKTPLDSYRKQFEDQRKLQYEIQTKLKQEQKLSELDYMSLEIKRGKLKKNEKISSVTLSSNEKNNIVSEESSQSKGRDENISEPFDEVKFEQFKQSEIRKVERYGTEQTWIKMPVKSELPLQYERIELDVLALNDEESLKYAVFCDLHYQGYFLTDGVKFGGHYLVYPGDPGIYHSSYIVLCVPFTKKLSLADYSTLGRLATSVKKTLLLCSVDKNNEIVYSSIAWSGLV